MANTVIKLYSYLESATELQRRVDGPEILVSSQILKSWMTQSLG
jgi:hypothetical protein